MPRIFVASCLVGLLVLVGCGGGGGSDAPVDAGAPGTLRALAVEGAVAPDSGGGTFAAFPTFPVMAAAANAWSAFAAAIVTGNSATILYVAQPDATPTLVRVFGEGDAVTGTDRVITAFDAVWMCDDGTVVTLVSLGGGVETRDFALLAADVAAGVASNHRTVLLDEASLAPAIAAGVLSEIDTDSLLKEDDGTLWFLAEDATATEWHLVSIELDGTGLTRRASPGDAISGTPDVVATIDTFGVDPLGLFFGWVVTDSGGVRRLNLRENVAIAPINVQVLQDGNPLPSGVGTVADAWKRGRIIVYGDASVIWVAKGSSSGADDILMLYQHNATTQYRELARVTETAPNTGLGTWSRIDTLNAAQAAQRALFNGGVAGGTFGITNATYRVDSINPLTVRSDTADIVLSQGQVQQAPYISLRQTNQPYNEVASNGDFGYAQTWSTTSALWWLVRSAGNNIFAVAAQGGPAPGGLTFGSFAAGVGLTVAPGIFLFRGPLAPSGTGLFRQGP
ncbi:MAG: hypothetical protein O2894_07745 [Planctomycetota bacterium]|nr:hypothetical protein [Planctomycetota bacterium]